MENVTKLQELIKRYETEKPSEPVPSFFEIIGRHYDEDLISRMLKYVLEHDAGLVKNLLRFYGERKCSGENWEAESVRAEVFCEYGMGSAGRADIFVLVNGGEYTITFENKVWSGEGVGQTERYYAWVQRNYSRAKNAFFYLKPRLNSSQATCDRFYSMNFSELATLITEADNIFFNDFKQLIANKLNKGTGVMDSATQKYILENYKTLRRLLSDFERDVTNFRYEIVSSLLDDGTDKPHIRGLKYGPRQHASIGELGFQVKDGDKTFRIYVVEDEQNGKENKWSYWSNHALIDSFYVYAEIKFEDDKSDLPFGKITCQLTMKQYTREKSIVERFLESYDSPDGLKPEYNDYFVLKRWEFEDEGILLFSEESRSKLCREIADTMNEYIREASDLVEKFWEFRQSAAQ